MKSYTAHASAESPLLTARDVMARIGCSRSFVQDHKAALGARMLGALLRFPREDVEAFIARGATSATAETAAPTPIRPRPVVAHKSSINKVTQKPWGQAR